MTTLTAVAVATGISLDSLYRKVRSGRIEGAVKVDGVWQIPTAFITQHKKGAK